MRLGKYRYWFRGNPLRITTLSIGFVLLFSVIWMSSSYNQTMLEQNIRAFRILAGGLVFLMLFWIFWKNRITDDDCGAHFP